MHEIPESTQQPIIEDVSEEGSEGATDHEPESPLTAGRSPEGLKTRKDSGANPELHPAATPKTIAVEIINEILNIVFEAEEDY